ncbi:MAG: hypothetical protein EBR82_79420 [Caulobacteraceae bacterium]|nr:hypothetical protein [Caulobacteraceae bacterium]
MTTEAVDTVYPQGCCLILTRMLFSTWKTIPYPGVVALQYYTLIMSIDLTEFEFDSLVDILSEKEIGSGLGSLYEKLIAASEADEEDDAEDE